MNRNSTDVFKIAESATNQLVRFISPTFGPNGKKVLTKTSNGEPILAIDDGFRIATDFTLKDPLENAVVEIVKEDIKKFNTRFGEGTTGFLIILQALMNELARLNFKTSVVQELKKGVEEVKKALKKASKKVTSKQELKNIALTSYQDDHVAELISSFAFETGPDGKLAMEYSPTIETYLEKVDCYDLNGGFLDGTLPRMLDNPYVLLTDQVITDGTALVALMEKIINAGSKNLVIVAQKIEGTALATLLQNYRKDVFYTTAIRLPYGSEVLNDLQLVVGGEIFREAIGFDLGQIEVTQLGRVKKVVAQEENSLIVSHKRNKEIAKAVAKLKKEIKENPLKKDLVGGRIAKLSQLVGVIKIGSPTSKEVLAIQYKVEDAIHAVKLAQTGGGVAGAGEALSKVKTSSEILNRALSAPKKQLLENGSDISPYALDPTDVLIGQVEAAVSTASLLLSLCGIQVEEKDESKTHQETTRVR